jgi:hypothetical protein
MIPKYSNSFGIPDLYPPNQYSNAAGSNSKLLAGFIERDSFLTLFSLHQPALHVLALEQVSRLSFGFNLPPQFNRNGNPDGITVLI